jgi:hypothetical protein
VWGGPRAETVEDREGEAVACRFDTLTIRAVMQPARDRGVAFTVPKTIPKIKKGAPASMGGPHSPQGSWMSAWTPICPAEARGVSRNGSAVPTDPSFTVSAYLNVIAAQ